MTPSASGVRIWWDASISGYRLTWPYNKALIDLFKSQIPASDRDHDDKTKIWTFHERWLDLTVGLVEQVIRQKPVVVTRKDVERAAGTSVTSTSNKPIADVIVDFVKACPYEAMQACYRKAAMMLHPDRGGSMEKMAAVNSAWNRIEKEIYGQ